MFTRATSRRRFARQVIVILGFISGEAHVASAQLVTRSSGTISTESQRALLANPSLDFFIGLAGRLQKGDNNGDRDALTKMLKELQNQKSALSGQIVQTRQQLTAGCALPENTARCSQLAQEVLAFNANYGGPLTTARRDLSAGREPATSDITQLANALGTGGRSAMALAMSILTQIVEAPAANRR